MDDDGRASCTGTGPAVEPMLEEERDGMAMNVRTCLQRVAMAAAATASVAACAAPASAAERAYELVTPSGVDVDVRYGNGLSTPDGNLACWHSERSYLGAFVKGLVTSDTGYCAARSSDGWRSEWATGPRPQGALQGAMGSQVVFASPDGRRVVFASDTGIFPDYVSEMGAPTQGIVSAYSREAGQTRWLAPAPNPPVDENIMAGGFGSREPLGVSSDGRYGVFASVGQLLPQDTNSLVDVYKWTPDGIELVSSDAAGNAVGGSPPTLQPPFLQPHANFRGGITEDGSRVIFHHAGALVDGAPADAVSVFARSERGLRLLSPRRGPAGPNAEIRFAGGSEDGRLVYLSTAQQITADAKEADDALYRYDTETDVLTLVATAADGIVPLDVSRDGRTVVYTTKGFMPPLMVQRGGVTTTLGNAFRALDGDDIPSLFPGGVVSPRPDRRALRISDDGRVIVFASAGDFAGATPGTIRVFRWEEGEGVRPVSVLSDGTLATRQAMIGNYSTINLVNTLRLSATLAAMRGNPNVGRVMSDDGNRIFFETDERLVERDVNHVVDVYEWDHGAVSIVSPGTQTHSALYHDNSADGSTVFFTTAARLIPELDRNSSRDLYAARIGGGFPLPEVQERCQGENCQGPPATQPSNPRPASTTFDGPGDERVEPPITSRHSVTRLTARQRRAFARRGRVGLRVRTNAGGVITVRVHARIRRRNVLVADAARAARRGATVTVPLTLSQRARDVLRHRGKLRLVIRVFYSESDRTARQVVVLRAA